MQPAMVVMYASCSLFLRGRRVVATMETLESSPMVATTLAVAAAALVAAALAAATISRANLNGFV